MNSAEHGCIRVIGAVSAVLGLWVFGAHAAELPPDPNNAALLYYQALALWSDVRSSYVDRESAQEPNGRSDTEPNTAKPKPDKYDMLFQIGREQEEADRESSRQRMRGLTIELIEAAATGAKEVAEEVRRITDTVLISEIRKEASSAFADFLDSVNRAVERNKPYDQTYMEIESLTYKLRVNHIIVSLCDLTPVEITPDFYRISVRHRASMNATKAAIEIYLIKAKTGKLPDKLPGGLPKDPYTRTDFGYEIIDGRFALRCQGKQFQRERPRRTLEFKVRE